jgi:hypothetical protein
VLHRKTKQEIWNYGTIVFSITLTMEDELNVLLVLLNYHFFLIFSLIKNFNTINWNNRYKYRYAGCVHVQLDFMLEESTHL